MKKTPFFLIIFIFLFLGTSFAETSVKAEVDKAKITTDEKLTYKLVITSSETKVSQPALPKFNGFTVLSQAQSSTMSFLKGGAKTILVYAFVLAPNEVGKFKLEPAVIKVKEEVYSTAAFEIEVTQGKLKPKLSPEKKPSLSPESPPESAEPQVTL